MLVLGTTIKSNYDRLIVLQKRVFCIIEKYKGHPMNLDTEPLFLKHENLPVRQVYNFKMMQHIHKHKLQDFHPQTIST